MMIVIKISVLFSFLGCYSCHFQEFYRWKQIKFQDIDDSDNFSLFKTFKKSIENVVPYNNVPMGITHYKGKFIVTIPRRKPGIPSTINYISSRLSKGSSPSLKSFPNLRTNELHPELKPDKNKIISVYRSRLDDCDRLWFVDTGALQYNGTIQVQRPSLWIVDMATERVIRRFEIPYYIVEPGHGLVSVKVDVDKNNCDNAYAYIPDLLTFQLHVYSFRQNKMWNFKHNYLSFESSHANFSVDGFKYTWRDGIFSITLGKRNRDGYRTAYFHPMASVAEYIVNTQVLQNEGASKRLDYGNDFKKLGERGANSQSAMHDFDQRSGIMFYSQIGKNGLSCWNSAKPFTPENNALLIRDDLSMVYPADLNVDRDGNLWVLTNTLPRFVYGKLNTNEYNFRIWKAKVQDLVKGTVCDNVEQRSNIV